MLCGVSPLWYEFVMFTYPGLECKAFSFLPLILDEPMIILKSSLLFGFKEYWMILSHLSIGDCQFSNQLMILANVWIGEVKPQIKKILKCFVCKKQKTKESSWIVLIWKIIYAWPDTKCFLFLSV